MERLTITIDADTLALLKQLAAEAHETVSNYVRQMVREKARAKYVRVTSAPKVDS